MSELQVLITGASTGIGAALAKEFARRNHSLILVARRGPLLKQLAADLRDAHGVNVLPITMDLARKRSAERLMARVAKAGLTVDVLVNNAGLAANGAFATMDADAIAGMIAVNVHSLTTLTRQALPGMIERGRGRILNIGSIVGFQPVPSLAVYAATKAFVLSFTESLSEELKGTGVTATALCPGMTNTQMVQNAAAANVPQYMLATPEEVAEAGYHACMNAEVIRVPGVANQMAVTWAQFQPRWLVRGITGMLARESLKT